MIPSSTPSITFPVIKITIHEYSGIFQSLKTNNPKRTITESTMIISWPIGSFVYLAIMAATISLPPDVALDLKMSPKPSPHRKPPKMDESNASPLTRGSKPHIKVSVSVKTAVSEKPSTVLNPNLGPSIFIPMIVNGISKHKAIKPTGVPRI